MVEKIALAKSSQAGQLFRTSKAVCPGSDVIDDFNREALGIEVDFSLPSERVIRSLEQIIEWRGKPGVLRCDNVSGKSAT